jgi:CDP-paratose 2-epimerase
MRILISGVCGFVGSRLAQAMVLRHPDWTILGFDNFIRQGSRSNQPVLQGLGIEVIEADLRDRGLASRLPNADWVIDCAANPSVLAGLGGAPPAVQSPSLESPSLEVLDHNLFGTVHLLEYCKRQVAGLILISTSRVYSVAPLNALPMRLVEDRFVLERPSGDSSSDPARDPRRDQYSPWRGVTDQGLTERFPTQPPISLYGVSKYSSELLALEYASAFGFPLWINRCGVMAGAGQFGRIDQGIVAYWIHSMREARPLTYVGFDGLGHQVRDCLHPEDLARLIEQQMTSGPGCGKPTICNVSGGIESAFSLRQLTQWCVNRWPDRAAHGAGISSDFAKRPFDCPWIVLDSSQAKGAWDWRPTWSREAIWDEVAQHAERHPHWLDGCQS